MLENLRSGARDSLIAENLSEAFEHERAGGSGSDTGSTLLPSLPPTHDMEGSGRFGKPPELVHFLQS